MINLLYGHPKKNFAKPESNDSAETGPRFIAEFRALKNRKAALVLLRGVMFP